MLEHSPLGASSAERWMNCPGSVGLINLLTANRKHVLYEDGDEDAPDCVKDRNGDVVLGLCRVCGRAEVELDQDKGNCPGSVSLIELLRTSDTGKLEDEPGYRTDGTNAHTMAADCLNSGWDAWEHDTATEDNMEAVQVYLDYVRSKQGWQFTELRMHRPEFHELMYGTTDACVLDPERLEVIDYKHGVGIVVEVEENPQIMYYAFMVIDELGSAWPDDCPITLTICQPRVSWRDPVRSWQTTVGYIRGWAQDTLKPAMDRVYADAYLSPGEHCRFCPAKLLCPAFLSVANRARKLSLEDIKAMNEPLLAEFLKDVAVHRMIPKALEAEAVARTIRGKKNIPGWKIVKAITRRIWKTEAPVYALLPPERMSVAQVEKDSDKGKAFVAEWAYAPDGGYDIVPEADKRKAVELKTSGEIWEKFVENLK